MDWPFGNLQPHMYDVVMIDVPWRWRNWTVKHNTRSPEAKYPTMSIDEAAQLPVRDLLKPGGVAIIYCTWPLIAEVPGMVQHSWRLDIRTGGVWAKRTKNGHLRMGTGFILRSVCEPFLIAINGKQHTAPRGRGLRNLVETIDAAVADGLARQHSRKPDEMYRLVEALTPGANRADVYSRQRRPGWDSFGNETTKFNDKKRRMK